MEKEVRRSIISGRVDAPASAAMAHRAIIAACFSPGASLVSGIPDSEDIQATIGACEAIGADIVTDKGVADIFGPEMLLAPNEIDCKKSNTTLKLFLPICSLFDSPSKLSGSGRLSRKMLRPFSEYLNGLAVSSSDSNGFLPIKVKGPLVADNIVYFSGLGTQFLSGFLLSAPMRMQDTAIVIEGKTRGMGYIDKTIDMMEKCGVEFFSKKQGMIYLAGRQGFLSPEELQVPASPYLSSFLLLAGAVGGKVIVEKMPKYSRLEKLLSKFGAHAKFSEGNFTASAGVLEGTELNANELDELLVHAMVLASLSTKETKLLGISSLGKRQSNRMRLMARELSRMGAKVKEAPGSLLVSGGNLQGAEIEPENDPAVAMACSAAAVCASGFTKIKGAEIVSRSFPGFFRNLAMLGAIVR